MEEVETNDNLKEAYQFNVEELNPVVETSGKSREQEVPSVPTVYEEKKGPRIVKKQSHSNSSMTKNQQDHKIKNQTNCGRTNPPFYNPERVFGPNLPNSLRKSAPQYSFGNRRESSTDINGCGRSPGPIYNVTKAVNYIKKRAPAYTIGIKTKIC
ncbi:hypothetical protein BpHYR1_027957 [Brachionus plicatilis]|uniref:Uncharacterized protein n=1 Tax=Brachionus plicatilis TaxID=10195 RepID=A0A3M7Q5D4_BRAPC|nr:hypothetical protein BpHYR1_027957 [Brachionus plicatilis]